MPEQASNGMPEPAAPDLTRPQGQGPGGQGPDGAAELPRWGMVVDLDRCTGCEACVLACHAENNLPIVGEEECHNDRAFNWIRVERYALLGSGSKYSSRLPPAGTPSEIPIDWAALTSAWPGVTVRSLPATS